MRLAHQGCATSNTVQVVQVYRPPVRLSEGGQCGQLTCVKTETASCARILQTDGHSPTTLEISVSRSTKTSTSTRRKEKNRSIGRKKTDFGEAIVSTGKGVLRIYRVEIPVEKDLGKDDFTVSDAVLDGVAAVLGCTTARLPGCACSVVRKSFDAREEPTFVYTIDLHVEVLLKMWPGSKQLLARLKPKTGILEYAEGFWESTDLVTLLHQPIDGAVEATEQERPAERLSTINHDESNDGDGRIYSPNPASTQPRRPRVVVVGSGPAGLFAALSLAESDVEVTLVERGQPVQGRGRDIGKLMVRHILDPDSNLCFGEGGAGTWSDGKLTTRTGRNGISVQTVLATLVRFGAPRHILIDGKPHVGTDKLIHILRAFRHHLEQLGVKIMFGTRMEDLIVRNSRAVGVKVRSSVERLGEQETMLEADAVVLGVGHSARDVYEVLLSHNVTLSPKDFAVGFRVEHPQHLINEMQYRKWAAEVQKGKGKVPVADYKVAVNLPNSLSEEGNANRGCYSFCMCPGGQVVPTSTIETELCINGMSFSNRASKWANAAIVVSVSSSETRAFVSHLEPLPGVAFQRLLEQEAAQRGGGQLVAPAQTVPDFLDGVLSESKLPPSSYRLGVRPAHLHDLLPANLTNAVREGLVRFDRQMPGFIDRCGLLHGVETRTSSPIRIDRHEGTFECLSMAGLYPIGEGAGYAGGIVSAAADGMHAGIAVARHLYPTKVQLQNLVI